MTTVESAVIGGVTFPIAGAWKILDLTPLLEEADPRGDDQTIHGANGQTHRDKKRDVAVVSLPLLIYGENDQASVAHPDVRTGLKDNLIYLRGQLLDHNVGDVTCTTTWPDASTLTGSVSVIHIRAENLTPEASVLRAVMRLKLLAGKLS